MKKTVLFMAFVILSVCSALAQDSIKTGISAQHKTITHKKAMHSQGTMPLDSVSGGKVTTNPHGKTISSSPGMKRKTTKTTTQSSASDSAR